jgi:alpha-D-ribose 1-methylphosphonate 5-triphosphate synthase subunit PhnH
VTTTLSETGQLVRTLIRTSQQSQRDFRALLHALARPGTLHRLDMAAASPPVPAAAVAAAGLADVEVSMAVLAEDGDPVAAALHAATGAPAVSLIRADLVVALRPPQPAEVRVLRQGDPLHPEHAARLVVAVPRLGGPAADLTVQLRGPGIRDACELRVSGLPAEVFDELASAARFPCGVDTFLVADDGTVAGLPRSAEIRVLDRGPARERPHEPAGDDHGTACVRMRDGGEG